MITILVIDDERPVRHLLRDILRDEGYRVLLTDRGEEALAYLRTVHIDLILCDVMMPGMDGVEFSTRVVENPSFSCIPLMMMSAAQEPKDIPTPPYAGFLSKPFHIDTLLSQIDEIFHGPQSQSFNSPFLVSSLASTQVRSA